MDVLKTRALLFGVCIRAFETPIHVPQAPCFAANSIDPRYVPFFCKDNAYAGQYRFIKGSRGATEFAIPHPDDAPAFYQKLGRFRHNMV